VTLQNLHTMQEVRENQHLLTQVKLGIPCRC